MKRFRLAPQARQDVKDISAYIARDSTEAAARVRQQIPRQLPATCSVPPHRPPAG